MKRFHILPESDVIACVSHLKKAPGVFLESALCSKDDHTSYLFLAPERILSYYQDQPVDEFFNLIESWVSKGYWIAGYFTYEFGYALESTLNPLLSKRKINFPLAWLGIFKNPILIDHKRPRHGSLNMINAGAKYTFKKGNFNITNQKYYASLSKIKYYLKQGDTYQVNYTLKNKSNFTGSMPHLYAALRRNQLTAYSGFINDGQRCILSYSPELFFKTTSRTIITKPMKGTWCRGRTIEEDNRNIHFLKNDLKNRAENMMIVDLLRNDLGKIACPGSIRVHRLFGVETYASLLQMTSTVTADLRKSVSLQEIFTALFPSGSVTGAPKIRTMEIIHELETGPRDVYTGAIGYISPHRKICFNVAIRTLIINKKRAEFGVGGGIVADSVVKDEYKECELKTSFLMCKTHDFSLIETIGWEKGRYKLLRLHRERLAQSARYFNRYFSRREFGKKLTVIAGNFSLRRKYTVRVLVNAQGDMAVSYTSLAEILCPVSVTVSVHTMRADNIFLYHKTTNRERYNTERLKAQKKGFFDIIFMNDKHQLTEGAVTNIFIKKNGILYTPKIESGLLPGVLREHLLRRGKAQEKDLYINDLKKADGIYIGNSVRGLIPVKVFKA